MHALLLAVGLAALAQTPGTLVLTAAGTFQSELGCPSDWAPDCATGHMQDPDGDGTYTFSSATIPVGDYDFKVALDNAWTESYPTTGNVSFHVPSLGAIVTLTYVASTHETIASVTEPQGDVTRSRGQWLDATTLVWPGVTVASGGHVSLFTSATAALVVTGNSVTGGIETPLTPSAGLGEALKIRFPTVKDAAAFTVPAVELTTLIQGQHLLAAFDSAGNVTDFTQVQLAGVLDAAFPYSGELGVTWASGVPTLRVWAPTASSVAVHLYADATTATGSLVSMQRDPKTGVWTATGDATWKNEFYLYEVTVYAPSTRKVEHNLVTDPYSVSLAGNSRRTQIVDLADPALTPEGFATLLKPQLPRRIDAAVYELHLREFSIDDATVPVEHRGTYLAFTDRDSNGMKHLARIANAGITHVQLQPFFDYATVDELGRAAEPTVGRVTLPADVADAGAGSEAQQKWVTDHAGADFYNWGYDPFHFSAPEGSYSTAPDGSARVKELRQLVQSLAGVGLRVVMDVVYNHTDASGQDAKSVLDRVVPGYYHRLGLNGDVLTSTCCQNTATEHAMMEKLMVDSLLLWARQYKLDGFRFDIMGHHSRDTLLRIKNALGALTLEKDGVDGSKILLYGEGWDFGETQGNALFTSATQLSLGDAGIGTFNDRLRDAAKDFSENHRDGLTARTDLVRLGLAGNLADFVFQTANGNTQSGAEISFGGSPAGYNLRPEDAIQYVSVHDDRNLFDHVQLNAAKATDLATRLRMDAMAQSLVALAQGTPFFYSGDELLRSKSGDRNSFDSGDWFNRLDWTYQTNNWGRGLPPAADNQADWAALTPLLQQPALNPRPADINRALNAFTELLQIRRSSALFRLETAAEVISRVHFLNTGPAQRPGLLVMTLDGDPGSTTELQKIWVFFNATGTTQMFSADDWRGADVILHPVQAASDDPVLKGATFVASLGQFTVPAWTTAVFVTPPATGKGHITEPPRSTPAATKKGCGCEGSSGELMFGLALLALGTLRRRVR